MRPITLLIILLLSTYISGKSKEEWKSRSIYQILTDRFARTSDTGSCNYSQYCGGNYQGIINKLDYIKGMGFDAIWISPIVENTDGSYHGYHLTNLYNLNPHFGSEDDFKSLITACHNKDIWVMVDVVANHVGPIGTDYSRITPFNLAELVAAAGATYSARWTTIQIESLVTAIKDGLKNPGFSFIEVVTQCPTYYGRKNKLRTPTAMAVTLKMNTVFKSAADRMSAKELEGKIVVGEFANTQRDELSIEKGSLTAKINLLEQKDIPEAQAEVNAFMDVLKKENEELVNSTYEPFFNKLVDGEGKTLQQISSMASEQIIPCEIVHPYNY